MSQRRESDRILARALELHHAADDSIPRARAEEIVAELGIDPTAWQLSLNEPKRESSAPAQVVASPPRGPRRVLLASTTLVIGAGWSLARRAFEIPGWADRPLMGLLVAVALEPVVWHARRGSMGGYRRDLLAWWGGLLLGLAVGFGGDAVWFAGAGRAP